jgi:hypothetical protein
MAIRTLGPGAPTIRMLAPGDEDVLAGLARDEAAFDVPGRGRRRPPLSHPAAEAFYAACRFRRDDDQPIQMSRRPFDWVERDVSRSRESRDAPATGLRPLRLHAGYTGVPLGRIRDPLARLAKPQAVVLEDAVVTTLRRRMTMHAAKPPLTPWCLIQIAGTSARPEV